MFKCHPHTPQIALTHTHTHTHSGKSLIPRVTTHLRLQLEGYSYLRTKGSSRIIFNWGGLYVACTSTLPWSMVKYLKRWLFALTINVSRCLNAILDIFVASHPWLFYILIRVWVLWHQTLVKICFFNVFVQRSWKSKKKQENLGRT